MPSLRKSAVISLVLGLASLAAILLSHLALTDIWHAREPDLSLEWRVLQIAFLVVIVFHVSALRTLLRVLKNPSP